MTSDGRGEGAGSFLKITARADVRPPRHRGCHRAGEDRGGAPFRHEGARLVAMLTSQYRPLDLFAARGGFVGQEASVARVAEPGPYARRCGESAAWLMQDRKQPVALDTVAAASEAGRKEDGMPRARTMAGEPARAAGKRTAVQRRPTAMMFVLLSSATCPPGADPAA